jgi:hypothetical protein
MLIKEISPEEDQNFGHTMQCWEMMFNKWMLKVIF